MAEDLRVLLMSAASEGTLLERLLAYRAASSTAVAEAAEPAPRDTVGLPGQEPYRLALLYGSARELERRLDAAIRGDSRHGVIRGVAGEPRVAFVFTGHGPQHWRMGGELFDREPVFRDVITECDAMVRRARGWSLADQLYGDEEESRLTHPEMRVSQVALVAVQAGLAALWRSYGVEPTATIGHSLGEIAAAHVAGALDLGTAIGLALVRGELMQRAADSSVRPGGMAAIRLGQEEVRRIIQADSRLSLAACNAPRWATVSGPADSIAELRRSLEERHVECRILHVPVAAHSDQVDGIRAELEARLRDMPVARPGLRMYSTVTGTSLGAPPAAGYWGRNLRDQVRFAEAVGAALSDGIDTLVEVGPHPALTPAMNDCVKVSGKPGTVVSSLARDRADPRTMLTSLASLHVQGQYIAWHAVNLARVTDPGTPEKKGSHADAH